MTESDLYTAYLLGCEDECIPEPKTFEQFIGEWRENSRNSHGINNRLSAVVGEKSGRSVLSESSPVDLKAPSEEPHDCSKHAILRDDHGIHRCIICKKERKAESSPVDIKDAAQKWALELYSVQKMNAEAATFNREPEVRMTFSQFVQRLAAFYLHMREGK